jgi:hypothetical protein
VASRFGVAVCSLPGQHDAATRPHGALIHDDASVRETANERPQLDGLDLAHQEEVQVLGRAMVQVHCGEGRAAAEDRLPGEP